MNTMDAAVAAASALGAVMRLEAVTKRYGPVVALSDVTVDFHAGVVHAIVGENGAGKSTLINIASGVVTPNGGRIIFEGEIVKGASPAIMRRRGVAVVHQHPAIAPDLTVRENIALGLDGSLPTRETVDAALAEIAEDGMGIHPDDRMSDLTIAQWHVVEIAKAMLLRPKVLILDEPTEPFGKGEVERLFALLRARAQQGVAIVYISHRLKELLQIADFVTVIRDGRQISTTPRAAADEADIVAKIAGRAMDRVFPAKTPTPGSVRLSCRNLAGEGFSDVSIELRSGMIVGLAGIEGQGQRSFIRTLAGLGKASSGVLLSDGEPMRPSDRSAALSRRIGFITDDRHGEGLFKGLPIFENLTLPVLGEIVRNGLLSPRREISMAAAMVERFAVKMPGLHATPSQLSGGNQQKLLLTRELAAKPTVLLIDEPTKGVDVGARFEIYKALRREASEGMAVLVLCSDALELQGLCDVVHVFSSGRIVATLEEDSVTEANIAAAMIGGTSDKSDAISAARSTAFQRFLKGDFVPLLPLTFIILAIMAVAAFANPFYLTEFNLMSMAGLLAILAFVAMGQASVFSVGGIDLSSGPVAGLMVVLASFFISNDGGSVGGGIAICLAVALVIGLLHASIILLVGLPPIVVTLATYVAIGGLSLLLRPEPAGAISFDYMDAMSASVLFMPLGLLLALLATAVLATGFGFTKFGRRMRAWGSDPLAARRLGVNAVEITYAAYAIGALCSGIAGLLLAAQIGTGSATTGTQYTLMGITAFVISGAKISGGRLSLLAILMAALLVQVTLNVTTFLNIDTAWQQWLIGASVIIGAAVFSRLRNKSNIHE